jgi:hypothetical protein
MASETWGDPIVEEVRRVRDEYAASLDYDLDAIFRDMCEELEKARKEGATIIPAPQRTKRPAEPAA